MKNKTEPFFTPGPAADKAYVLNRDANSREDVRLLAESLWSRFRPFCGDRHFLSDARSHFHQRTWEMLLASLLLEHGFKLERTDGDEPDLKVRPNGSVLWVEAVAPGPGEGGDTARRVVSREEEHEHGKVSTYHVDRDKIILRYTAALWDKASLTRHLQSPDAEPSQYRRFLERGAVSPDDPFVVAINAGQIDDADIELEPPDIVRAVFPIGEPIYVVPFESSEAPTVEYPRRAEVTKSTGGEVRTDAFLSSEYEGVSAVLFYPHGIWNVRDLLGRSTVVVHNPRSRAPLPRGTFPFGREYWAEEDDTGGFIHRRAHRQRGDPGSPADYTSTSTS